MPSQTGQANHKKKQATKSGDRPREQPANRTATARPTRCPPSPFPSCRLTKPAVTRPHKPAMLAHTSLLPPELWLQVLGHLDKPTLTRQPLLTPLSVTSLVSRAFRALSQQILFEQVMFFCKDEVLAWAAADA